LNRAKAVIPLFIVFTLVFIGVTGLKLTGGFGIDDYHKEVFSITSNEFTVKINYVTPEEIKDLYFKYGGRKEDVLAFTYKTEEACVITTVRPTDWDDHRAMTILGHEIIHCQGGSHL
jgi:hypothetical protein